MQIERLDQNNNTLLGSKSVSLSPFSQQQAWLDWPLRFNPNDAKYYKHLQSIVKN